VGVGRRVGAGTIIQVEAGHGHTTSSMKIIYVLITIIIVTRPSDVWLRRVEDATSTYATLIRTYGRGSSSHVFSLLQHGNLAHLLNSFGFGDLASILLGRRSFGTGKKGDWAVRIGNRAAHALLHVEIASEVILSRTPKIYVMPRGRTLGG